MRSAVLLVSLLVWRGVAAAAILTNVNGEYFDTTDNGVLRYVYVQLNLTSGVVALQAFTPPLQTDTAATILSGGYARIEMEPVVVTKTLAEIVSAGKLTLDFQVKAIPNTALTTSSYQMAIQLLGQCLNSTLYYSTPNPEQYFLLVMTPPTPNTAGVTTNVFCDLSYDSAITNKWLLPYNNNYISPGLYLSSSWKTPQIVPKATGKLTIPLTFEIPYTSFVGLQEGNYQIRMAIVMAPYSPVAGLNAVQLATIQKLLDTAIYWSTTTNTTYRKNAAANAVFLEKLLIAIALAGKS